MTYTGYMDMKQERPPALPAVLARLDHDAEVIGLTLSLPEIVKARALQARAEELRAGYREHKAAKLDLAAEAARAYASGALEASDLYARIAEAALFTGDAEKTAARLVESAAADTERAGLPLLQGISEAKWLKLLRPIYDAALAAAHRAADDLGISEPRKAEKGVSHAAHPWAPTARDLRDMNVRHKWERLEAALDHLDNVHAFADRLRMWGLLPIVDDLTTREAYRWLHPENLRGSAGHVREFFLINRHTADPGLFTAAELTAPSLAEVG